MKRPGTEKILIAAGALVLAGVALWWHFSAEYEEEMRFRPENTKLLTEQFHVAERWLRRSGLRAGPLNNLNDLGDLAWSFDEPAVLIVLLAPGNYTEQQSSILWNWVNDGGHLIAPAPNRHRERPDHELNPHGIAVCWRCGDESEGEGEEYRQYRPARTALKTPAGEFEVWSRASLKISGSEAGSDIWRDAQGRALVADYRVGAGRVTLLAEIDWLGNRQLIHPGHARLLLALIDDDYEFVYLQHRASAGGLLGWLWRQAPALWLAALLAAVLWIWSRLPRFGPISESGIECVTQMREHLLATARYDWRHNRARALIAAMHEERGVRCAQRFPDWRQLDLIEQRERLQTLYPQAPKEALDRLVAARKAETPEQLIEFVALHNELMHAL